MTQPVVIRAREIERTTTWKIPVGLFGPVSMKIDWMISTVSLDHGIEFASDASF